MWSVMWSEKHEKNKKLADLRAWPHEKLFRVIIPYQAVVFQYIIYRKLSLSVVLLSNAYLWFPIRKTLKNTVCYG